MEGKGQDILNALREKASKAFGGAGTESPEFFARWANDPTLARSLESYNNGNTLYETLKSLRAFNTKTGRVDPTALAEGLAKLTGGKADAIFRQLRFSPGASRAIETASQAARGPKGQAPSTVPIPFVRAFGHHVGAGEGFPFKLGTRGVGPTATEATTREMAPSVAGALTQATPFPGLAADVLRLPRATREAK
jgi:hypothetical protein